MTDNWIKPNLAGLITNIGSKTFLQPKSLLILVVPLALITSLFTTTQGATYGYPAVLIANIGSLSLVTAVILLIRFFWSVLNPNFTFPITLVFVISGLLGFIKSFSTSFFLGLIVTESQAMVASSANWIGGAIAGAIAIPFASMAMVLINQFNSEREFLITNESIQRLGLASSGEIGRLKNLAETIRGVALSLASSNSELIPKLELGVIKSLVDKHLRPLANDLYQDASAQFQSFRFTELFKTAIKNPPPALALSLIYVSVLPAHINIFGVAQGATYNLFSAVASYLVIRFGWKLLVAIKTPKQIAYFTVTIFIPATLGYLAPLLTSLATPSNLIAMIATVSWLTQNAILIGMAFTAYQAAKANYQKLQRVFKDQSESSIALLAKKRRSFANQIHGEAQSRLMSVVLRNEAGGGLDKNFAIKELNAVADLIDSGPKLFTSLEQSLSSLKQNWSGFVEIDYEVDAGHLSETDQQVLYSIIEEGVSNALRHGLADRVEIRLADSELSITDNGMGPKKGNPGIGTQLVQSFAKDWELSARHDGGTQLKIHLKQISTSKQ